MFIIAFNDCKDGLPMVKCPNCGEQLPSPDKELKNSYFHLAQYTCVNCKTTFKTDQL